MKKALKTERKEGDLLRLEHDAKGMYVKAYPLKAYLTSRAYQ